MANQRDPDKRPSPDALLEAARRETDRSGRLKIFIGAAPGVGKTYEMLSSAHARLKAGVDVVVGVVETHGRVETEALLRGLEVIPRKRLTYRDQTIEEMDLDALIARRPQLALVDELAHTNAPGSRHPKRYLDVEELLSHGIDVYTAINIQHIESLNDVVAQITHVRVRETVPDSVVDRADAIELIDLTPDDLIQRLKEGKVYVPKQAERALEHYFSPGNLTALRELALRRTAERVDEQLLTHMQANAIQGPWAAGERILVCLSEDPRAAGLVRYTKRLADRLHAQWTAVSIETRRSLQLSDEQRDRLADTMRLAESLGGEALTLPGVGRRIADDVINFAQANNVTQIIIGKSTRSRWFELTRGSVVHDLVRRAGNISVNVIAGDELPVGKAAVQTAQRQEPFNPRPYLMALLLTAIGLGAAKLIQPFFGIENVDLVFITAVVGAAARYGLGPSLLASVAASLCYNFFFLPPVYTFTITDPTNVAAFFFFMLIALIVSNVAARVRTQADTAIGRVRTTESLYAFSRKLAGTATLDDVLWATAYQIALMLKVRVVLLLPEGGMLTVKSGYPPEDQLDQADLAAANWAWGNDRPAGRGSDTLPGGKRLFLPMRTGRGPIGVIGIDDDRTGPLLTPDQRRLLDALVDQGALAIERVLLGRGHGPGQAHGRIRPAARRAADLDLARSQDAAGLGARLGLGAARSRRQPERRPEARSARDRDRRVGAAEPVHRQSLGHDQAGIRRDRAEHRAARCRRDRRQRAAPCRQDPGASPRLAGACRRPADAGARCRAVRAGAVQSARQCRKIRALGHHHLDPRRARPRCRDAADPR
ncbi:two-component system sensor histidine kinase KdpD [Bradyrhizobium embrapense]